MSGAEALEALEAEVAALEAMADVAMFGAALAAGAIPPDARRPPFPHEVDARTDFAALDRAVSAGGELVADVLRQLRSDGLEAVADGLRGLGSAEAATERLLAIEPASDPTLAALLAEARSAVVARLVALYDQGRGQVVAEARKQGVSLDRGPTALAVGDADALAQLDQMARRSTLESLASALRALRDKAVQSPVAGDAGPLVDTLLGVGRSLSDLSLVDAARQAVAVATGLGRQAAVEEAPNEPASIYASEILDRNVCGPCSLVDGTTYASMAEARADYPNGLYKDCEGGLRCRGTLVYVWDKGGAGPPAPGPGATPPTQPPLPLPTAPRLPALAQLAVDHGNLSEADLKAAKRQLAGLKKAVRDKAEAVRIEAFGNLEQADALVLRSPPPLELVRDPVTGELRRRSTQAAEGTWDWFYSLHPEEQARLKRTFAYGEPGIGLNPDELVDHLRGLYGGGSFDQIIGRWLEETRRIDAAGAIGKGRLPSRLLYGDLDIDAVFGDGTFSVTDLFGEPDAAVRSVAATTKAQAEEFAARAFSPAKLGKAPYAMPELDFIEEVTDLEESARAIRPIADDPDFGPTYSPADDWVLRRLAELIPAGVDEDGTMALDELHQKIVALARLGGLA